MKFKTPLLYAFSIVLSIAIFSPHASAHEVADAMANAANHFLESLEDVQKAKASIDLKDEERRNTDDMRQLAKHHRHGLPQRVDRELTRGR